MNNTRKTLLVTAAAAALLAGAGLASAQGTNENHGAPGAAANDQKAPRGKMDHQPGSVSQKSPTPTAQAPTKEKPAPTALCHEGEAAGANRTGAHEREAGANRACAHEGEAGCGPGAWRLPTKDRRAGRRRANFEVTEPSHGSERGKGRDEIWRAGCAVGRTACENLDHAARRKDRAPDQRAFLNHGRRDCSRNSSSLQFACFDLGICPAISRL